MNAEVAMDLGGTTWAIVDSDFGRFAHDDSGVIIASH